MRAMLHLCGGPEERIYQIAEISGKNEIPENFLRKIIPLLSRAGLLRTQRGNGGGIGLGKPAAEITPLDVIEAVEGPIGLNKCLIHSDFCSNDQWCSVHVLWSEAQKTLKTMLSAKSLAELARESTNTLDTLMKRSNT